MSYSKWVIGVMILTLSTNYLRARAQISTPLASQSLQGCPEKCGNVTIPYPFGIGDKCYHSNFSITCNQTFDPPKPIYGKNLEVLEINVVDAQIRMPNYVARQCYNSSSGEQTYRFSPWTKLTKLTINTTLNTFAATGCDTFAWFTGNRSQDRSFKTGCMTQCSLDLQDIDNGTCSGAGCCETQIPTDVHYITIEARSFSNYTRTQEGFPVTPCSSAFVVAKDSFNFTLTDLTMEPDQMPEARPVIYDWTIGNETCAMAQAQGDCLCCDESGSSECLDNSELGGYRCSCLPGYSGNPYLPQGCQDINECSSGNANNCKEPATCVNSEGSYNCQCPAGFQGNGTTLDPCITIQKNTLSGQEALPSNLLIRAMCIVSGWFLLNF